MKKNIKACTHMKCLQKKAVKLVAQNPPKRQCNTCKQQDFDQNIICLHCDTLFDSQCLIKHQQQYNSHVFSININFFLLSCKLCNDDIQSMIQNYQGQQKDEGYQRMMRFTQFIRQAWIKIAIFYDIFTIQTNNSFYIRGLQNLGNTCFLNASLQVLSLTKPLVKLYTQVNFQQKINRKLLTKSIQIFYDEMIQQNQNQTWHIVANKKQRKLKQNNKLLGSISTVHNNKFNIVFSKFIINKLAQNSQSLSPLQILNKLCEFDKKYKNQQEQDAQQLLILILDSLSQGEMLSLNYDKQRYKKVQKILGTQKLSMIQNIFGSYLASQVICEKCKKQNWTLDITYHFSVPIRKRNSKFFKNQNRQPVKNIKYHKQLYYPQCNSEPQPFLSPFFQQQQLSKFQNYYTCQKCKSNFAKKRFFIVDPPQILIISLKRFEKQYKIKDIIDFPQVLDISMLCLSDKEEKINNYKLYGMIVHEGQTVNSGHYICYLKQQSNWFRCSDQSIRKVTWKQVKNKQGYIFLYQRQNK